MDELTTAERHALDAWQPFEPPRGFAERVVGLRAKRRNPTIPLFAGLLVAVAVMLVILLGVERPASHTVVEPPPPPPALELVAIGPDLRVAVGEPFTVHDPHGEVAVELTYGKPCPERELDLDRDITLGHPRTLTGDAARVLRLTAGTWSYELRCARGGPDVALGTITVIEDAADRPLPAPVERVAIALDGRARSIGYTVWPPDLLIKLPDHGTRWSVEVRPMRGEVLGFESATPEITVHGASLDPGIFTLTGSRDGIQVGSPTVVFFGGDQTEPTLELKSASDGRTTVVAGTTRPGWTAELEGRPLSIDGSGHFGAKVDTTAPRTLVLVMKRSNPHVHYYLIRPRLHQR